MIPSPVGPSVWVGIKRVTACIVLPINACILFKSVQTDVLFLQGILPSHTPQDAKGHNEIRGKKQCGFSTDCQQNQLARQLPFQTGYRF